MIWNYLTKLEQFLCKMQRCCTTKPRLGNKSRCSTRQLLLLQKQKHLYILFFNFLFKLLALPSLLFFSQHGCILQLHYLIVVVISADSFPLFAVNFFFFILIYFVSNFIFFSTELHWLVILTWFLKRSQKNAPTHCHKRQVCVCATVGVTHGSCAVCLVELLSKWQLHCRLKRQQTISAW